MSVISWNSCSSNVAYMPLLGRMHSHWRAQNINALLEPSTTVTVQTLQHLCWQPTDHFHFAFTWEENWWEKSRMHVTEGRILFSLLLRRRGRDVCQWCGPHWRADGSEPVPNIRQWRHTDSLGCNIEGHAAVHTSKEKKGEDAWANTRYFMLLEIMTWWQGASNPILFFHKRS